MSVCLVCYNMCFVFIADNRRPLEGRKQQPLILCAGQAFLHSRVWSIHSPRAEWLYTTLDTAFARTHTHTKTRFYWQSPANGHKAHQAIKAFLLPASAFTNRYMHEQRQQILPLTERKEQMHSTRRFLYHEQPMRGWGCISALNPLSCTRQIKH